MNEDLMRLAGRRAAHFVRLHRPCGLDADDVAALLAEELWRAETRRAIEGNRPYPWANRVYTYALRRVKNEARGNLRRKRREAAAWAWREAARRDEEAGRRTIRRVRAVLVRLAPDDAALCRDFMRLRTLAAVAAARGVAVSTLHDAWARMAARFRKVFASLG